MHIHQQPIRITPKSPAHIHTALRFRKLRQNRSDPNPGSAPMERITLHSQSRCLYPNHPQRAHIVPLHIMPAYRSTDNILLHHLHKYTHIQAHIQSIAGHRRLARQTQRTIAKAIGIAIFSRWSFVLVFSRFAHRVPGFRNTI